MSRQWTGSKRAGHNHVLMKGACGARNGLVMGGQQRDELLQDKAQRVYTEITAARLS